jgi:hypothetical protein
MTTLEFKDFAGMMENSETKLNGLFLFTLRNYCGLCTKATEEIVKQKESNFPELFEVACETEDELFSLDLMVVPIFRLYKHGKMVWQRGGILYEKQLKEMLEIYGK